MTETPGPGGESPEIVRRRRELALQMTALGLEFSGSVIGGLALGYYLDRWLGTGPWLVIALTFGGMIAAVVRIIQLTQRFQRLRERRDA